MGNMLKIPLQFFAEGGNETPPEGDPGNTQPPAGITVDIDAIVTQASTKAAEAAEKKMQAVFKSMLKQEGLDPDTIKSITDDWTEKHPQKDSGQPEGNEVFQKLLERFEDLENKYRASQEDKSHNVLRPFPNCRTINHSV